VGENNTIKAFFNVLCNTRVISRYFGDIITPDDNMLFIIAAITMLFVIIIIFAKKIIFPIDSCVTP